MATTWSAGASGVLLLTLAFVIVLAVRRSAVDEALHKAILKDDTGTVVRLLREGADPNHRRGTGRVAEALQLWEHIRARLGRRPPPKPSDYHPTPLETTFRPRQVEDSSICMTPPENPLMVEALLRAGASVTFEGSNDDTPLDLAAQNGHWQSAKLLISFGADVNHVCGCAPGTPLASARGHYQATRWLLDSGAKVNLSDGASTPLGYAAEMGDLRTVTLLVHRGARLDTPDSTGYTPLMSAAVGGHTSVVTFLLHAGADVDRRGKYESIFDLVSESPFLDALQQQRMIRLLARAKPDRKDHGPLRPSPSHSPVSLLAPLR